MCLTNRTSLGDDTFIMQWVIRFTNGYEGVVVFTGNTHTCNRGLVPSRDIHFYLILWYVAKEIPTLEELSLSLSRSSFNYFDSDIFCTIFVT